MSVLLPRSALLLACAPAALLVASAILPASAGGSSTPIAAAGSSAKPSPTPQKAAPPTKPPPAPSTQPAAAPPVVLVPKAWSRSIYSLDGRVVTAVNDVSFEAPPAYQESFAFWTGRMKGGQRTELIQLLTTTHERAEDGSMPFRRQVSKFQVDIFEQGQNKTPAGGLTQQVLSLVWEGVLDPLGNVRNISLTSGSESQESIDQLSFDLLDLLYPRLGERRELKTGDSFTEAFSMRLPQRLSVKGLDEMGVLVTRTFTLREVRGDQAVFHIRVTYQTDPTTPPTAEKTTCTIGGDGAGEAVFDRNDGLFVRAQVETHMVINLEAPLRRLPDQPEGFDPGSAKSRIDLALTVSGTQLLTRLFQDEQEPAEGADKGGEPPAPGF